MKTLFTLSALFILLGNNIFAQNHNLKVFLTSKSSDIFIENVSLRVNGKYVGVKPKRNGEFDIQLATGKYKLVFSHVGFKITESQFYLKSDSTI